jgi:zinc transporter ZupT
LGSVTYFSSFIIRSRSNTLAQIAGFVKLQVNDKAISSQASFAAQKDDFSSGHGSMSSTVSASGDSVDARYRFRGMEASAASSAGAIVSESIFHLVTGQ